MTDPITPGEHDPEKLQKMLERFRERGSLDAGERANHRTDANPWGEAQLAAEKLVRFFKMVVFDHGLTDEEIVYAAELFALNVLNADDCPLSGTAKDRATSLADAYYKAALKVL